MYLDRRLLAFTEGVRLRIAWAVAVGLLAAAVGILRLALLGWLLARILAGAPLVEVLGLVALVGVATVGRGALEFHRNMVAHGTAGRVQARLRRDLYERVCSLGPGHFTGARTGEVILSMVEGVQQLEVYFGQYLPQLFVAALTPLLIFGFMAVLDLPVALVLLVAALATLLAPALWHRWDSAASQERQKAYSAFAAEFLDAIQGLPTLQAFGQSRSRGRLLEEKGRDLFRRTMWVLGSNTLARGITDTGIALGAAAALGLGAWRVSTGQMPLATLLVILMLGIEVFRPLRELRVLLHQGMLGLSAAKGILALLAAEPAVRDAVDATADDVPLSPTIVFERVSFAYPGARRPAHDALDFAVGAGERVAVVGPSGSGKSTVAKLLLRLHDPQRGRVLVGGRDVRDLSFDRLRRHIAVVNQDTYLFHGTVEDNLRLGKPDATPAELDAAARAANAHDFVAALPQGYRTVVGERGVRLSGGQRQRIAIARALLRDAPILVLDEALSSVDAENEAVIQEALDRLMKGRTTLIFAHRLSSVIGADRILVLDAGRVVESGAHAALMARGGAYHRLMAAQLTGPLDMDTIAALAPASPDGAGDDVDAAGRAGPAASARGDAGPAAGAIGWPAAIRILLGMIRGFRARLGATFVLGVARVAALVGVGVLSALVVLAVKQDRPWGALLAALAVVALLAGVLHWLESWLAHDVAYRLLADMRMALFHKLDALGPAYLVRRRSGDLVGVATHDVEFIEYFFAHTVTPVLVAVLVPTAVLATLGLHGWPLALALLPFLLYAGVSPLLARGRIDRLASRAREASGVLNAHAADAVQGLAELVAFQHERAWGAAFEARAQAYVRARGPFLRDLSLQGALQEIATGLGGLAVIGAGATLVAAGGLDAGILPLLTLLALSAFVPVWEVAQVGRQLADTLASTRRVHAVHAEPVTVADGPGARAPRAAGAPALEMTDVTFTYPGRQRPALAGVSLSVPAGATVALVGPSGAGKTTVAALLLRFWDPQRGVVWLDGHDLRAWRLDDLRRGIALVAQDTYLFNATLRENIMIARPEAADAELTAAVERAALAGFVAELPAGLDTLVGERGARLSGGQRQRVAIARAFLKDAPVLILDEATSHLDAVNEQAVRAALAELARNRTTLVIAHRLSTIREADRIVVLDDGRVVEAGRHDALLGRRGLYARLVSRQLAVSAAG
ncbi:MAG: thiol reductant ABC exporter subunit CydC [Candidatus Rokuibacteriota bacterium]